MQFSGPEESGHFEDPIVAVGSFAEILIIDGRDLEIHMTGRLEIAFHFIGPGYFQTSRKTEDSGVSNPHKGVIGKEFTHLMGHSLFAVCVYGTFPFSG